MTDAPRPGSWRSRDGAPRRTGDAPWPPQYAKAPGVTRERLYLDTMQEVLSQSSKVLVTGQQGQNNLIYLPLDKMIDGRGSATPGSGAAGTTSSTPDIGSRVASDLQQRDLRTRESR